MTSRSGPRVLVLGCGSIGRRHAANASARGYVGVYDPDASRAQSLADEISGEAFSSLAAALAWRPDAAIVAVPTNEHVTVASACIEQGIRVLVEKPIAHEHASAEAMLMHADKTNVSVFVGCNMRFHPGPATLKTALERIGKPLFLRAHFGNYLPNMRPGRDYRELYCAHREAGGGVILDSIHEVDYAAWLLGPIMKIRSVAGRLSDLDIDVEDYAVLALEHANGARSEIHLDYLQRVKRRGCEVVGTEGTLVWQSDGKSPEWLEVRFLPASGEDPVIVASDHDVDGNAPYAKMMDAFLGDNDDQRLLSGWDGLNSLDACLAALQAAETADERVVTWRDAGGIVHV